ncbi:DUF397 domain-containing protein [Nocardia nova]|nr:DUF397 domain-containing protein [Nocardia nova]
MGHAVTVRALRGGWFKSSRSNDGTNCVEIKFTDHRVLVRDSKFLRDPANDPQAQPIIAVPADLWSRVLDLALSSKSGSVDDALTLTVHSDDSATLRGGNTELVYTPAEWDAFVKGVADGEFTAA